MKEKIVEIVAPDIHRAFDTIKRMPAAKEVQAFGDRLNVVIAADHNESEIERYLKSEGIEVTQVRIVQPSLENVFISLMKQETPKEAEAEQQS